MSSFRRSIPYGDPVAAFAPFQDAPFALLLHGPGGRYSYICTNPLATRLWTDGADDPLADIAAQMAELPFDRPAGAPPFLGGWAGLLSYEFGRALLPRVEAGPPRGAWPDLAFGLYDHLAVYDHQDQTAAIYAQGWGRDPALLADQLAHDMANGRAADTPLNVQPRLRETRAAILDKIERVVAYVRAGDCFQANLSHAWDVAPPAAAAPFDMLVHLARSAASPFAAYFRLPDLALVSNSPERFVHIRCDGDALYASTEPIKGTRPRYDDPARDAAAAAELQASEKDRAENLMIVDLMRNDLSKVCVPGTVKVPSLFELKSFASVHHLVSTVTGRMAPGLGPVDLLRAVFPGGSITGAPKIRAMQIIAELEDAARGPYCGSLVWMSPDGAMDSSILIRTATFERAGEGWSGGFRVGGGVVADSSADAEYQETLDKSRSLLAAFNPAQTGAAA